MRGNPIETAQYLGFHSPAKQLSVPSCGAIPSKQRGVQEKINPIRTFSPLMRGNPIETWACRQTSKKDGLFQSPHAGQSHRNSPVPLALAVAQLSFSPL